MVQCIFRKIMSNHPERYRTQNNPLTTTLVCFLYTLFLFYEFTLVLSLKKQTTSWTHSVSCLAMVRMDTPCLLISSSQREGENLPLGWKECCGVFHKTHLKKNAKVGPHFGPQSRHEFHEGLRALGPQHMGHNPLTHEGCGWNPCQMRFTLFNRLREREKF